jgi:hypothetical protein
VIEIFLSIFLVSEFHSWSFLYANGFQIIGHSSRSLPYNFELFGKLNVQNRERRSDVTIATGADDLADICIKTSSISTKFVKISTAMLSAAVAIGLNADVANAKPIVSIKALESTLEGVYKYQSPGWELARQKRTIAIKKMEVKKILSVNTDDSGNQYLVLPWIPGQVIPYKSLPTMNRLQNEMFAGAFGEISKDFLLHG